MKNVQNQIISANTLISFAIDFNLDELFKYNLYKRIILWKKENINRMIFFIAYVG